MTSPMDPSHWNWVGPVGAGKTNDDRRGCARHCGPLVQSGVISPTTLHPKKTPKRSCGFKSCRKTESSGETGGCPHTLPFGEDASIQSCRHRA